MLKLFPSSRMSNGNGNGSKLTVVDMVMKNGLAGLVIYLLITQIAPMVTEMKDSLERIEQAIERNNLIHQYGMFNQIDPSKSSEEAYRGSYQQDFLPPTLNP